MDDIDPAAYYEQAPLEIKAEILPAKREVQMPAALRPALLANRLMKKPMTAEQIVSEGLEGQLKTIKESVNTFSIFGKTYYFISGTQGLEKEIGSDAEYELLKILNTHIGEHSVEDVLAEAVNNAPSFFTFGDIVSLINSTGNSPIAYYGMLHTLIENGRIILSEDEKEIISEAKVCPLSRKEIRLLSASGLVRKRILVKVWQDYTYGYCAGLFKFFSSESLSKRLLSLDSTNADSTIRLTSKQATILHEYHLIQKQADVSGGKRWAGYALTLLGRKLLENIQMCEFRDNSRENRMRILKNRYETLIAGTYKSEIDRLPTLLNSLRIANKLNDMGDMIDYKHWLATAMVACIKNGVNFTKPQTRLLSTVDGNFALGLANKLFDEKKFENAHSIYESYGIVNLVADCANRKISDETLEKAWAIKFKKAYDSMNWFASRRGKPSPADWAREDLRLTQNGGHSVLLLLFDNPREFTKLSGVRVRDYSLYGCCTGAINRLENM